MISKRSAICFVLDGEEAAAVEYLKWLDSLLQEAEQTAS